MDEILRCICGKKVKKSVQCKICAQEIVGCLSCMRQCRYTSPIFHGNLCEDCVTYDYFDNIINPMHAIEFKGKIFDSRYINNCSSCGVLISPIYKKYFRRCSKFHSRCKKLFCTSCYKKHNCFSYCLSCRKYLLNGSYCADHYTYSISRDIKVQYYDGFSLLYECVNFITILKLDTKNLFYDLKKLFGIYYIRKLK